MEIAKRYKNDFWTIPLSTPNSYSTLFLNDHEMLSDYIQSSS